MQNLLLALYALPLLAIYGWYAYRRHRKESRHRATLSEAVAAGLLEPASLHPVIDNSACIGCAACVTACPEAPEHEVLGVIDGKAQLVSPTDCIGHGACRSACPTHAIDLVFGTATRGIDLPVLTPRFQTTVAGIYIAGELGGMGLIRNALTQGQQAMRYIAEDLRARPAASGETAELDVLIVGAGPAGFAAALTASSLGLRYRLLEQESLGGCVYQYPRRKLVMTQPVELPLLGRIQFKSISKEELLQFWSQSCTRLRLQVSTQQRVDAITAVPGGFAVQAAGRTHRSRSVLLAIGRRGTPRELGVPGEDLPKVVYRLLDPEQYQGAHVLVVGGGDSALEAAAATAEANAAQVTLSYRGSAFARAKPRNRERVAALGAQQRLQVLLDSSVRAIDADSVALEQQGRSLKLRNDSIIVNAGGVLPNEFLRTIGIQVDTKYGTA
jgi:thioredoxin reductase/ferredoxin